MGCRDLKVLHCEGSPPNEAGAEASTPVPMNKPEGLWGNTVPQVPHLEDKNVRLDQEFSIFSSGMNSSGEV